jgi:hypothetical protein
VTENQPVFLIHTRGLSKSSDIRFTMNETMVSELADSNGKVIDGAKLAMPVATNVSGVITSLPSTSRQLASINIYPNPANENLQVAFETCNQLAATCNLQLLSLNGVSMLNLQTASLNAGWHKVQADLRGLTPGIYFLRVTMNGESFNRKVVISRQGP